MNKTKLKTISRLLQVAVAVYILLLLIFRQLPLLWISLLVFLVLLLVFAFLLVEFALNPACPFGMIRFSDYTSERKIPAFANACGWFHAHRQAWKIPLADGACLSASFLPHPGAELCAIVFHGYGNAAEDAMCVYAKGLYEMGLSVLCPQARGHGASQGSFVDMGASAPADTALWIRTLREKQPNLRFVLFGVSMGASSAMLCADKNLEGVQAVIADCGYSSVLDEFTFQLHNLFGLPAFPFLHAACLAARIRTGLSLASIDCTDALSKTSLPCLFIHGKKDGFVPYWMAQKNCASCSSPQKELISTEARHGESVYKSPETYFAEIQRFLKQADIL